MKKFIHIPSGTEFDNRKQAILVMGRPRYKQALKNREFLFYSYTPQQSKKLMVESKKLMVSEIPNLNN